MARPDFIGIGQQKSGTRWLYQQLRGHPAFWLPPVKEFHYFNARFPSNKTLGRLNRRPDPEGRDGQFVRQLKAMTPARRTSVAEYYALFDLAGGDLTGEITPAYSSLPEAEVERLGREMRGTKAILLVRDPVDRAWSFLNDGANQGDLPAEVVTDPTAMIAALGPEEIAFKSRPSLIQARWSRHFPLLTLFLEDIAQRPDAVRAEVATWLGADPAGPWNVEADSNTKAGRKRAVQTPELRAALVEHFREEILRSAEVLGGPAVAWPAKHGLA